MILFGLLIELISKGLLFFALHINSGSSFPPALSSKEEKKLLDEFKNGNNNAKNKLVEHNPYPQCNCYGTCECAPCWYSQ